MAAPCLAGVELGGTNAIVVLGDGESILERVRFPVSDSAATLSLVRKQLERWNSIDPIDALGIACFGPLGIIPDTFDYGRILLTPKLGWSGADVLGTLRSAVDCPTAIDLDVNAAAIAEARLGSAKDCTDFAYITVGTGVGIAIISGGRPVVGRMHPEAGHIRVRRQTTDRFEGACAFHGDCLAGLISGPALAARTGLIGERIPVGHDVWSLVIDSLAEACATLFTSLSLDRIIVGGGVIVPRPALIEAVASAVTAKLGSFPPNIPSPAPVIPAALGAAAGSFGALLLASSILSEKDCQPIG